jgi:hypothetical protein
MIFVELFNFDLATAVTTFGVVIEPDGLGCPNYFLPSPAQRFGLMAARR